ncbi:hypothetical protein HMPREF9946_02975 [Acetobacteraceae bacterium AT-5844]|nr:hypothetical protein HMPREF9946_02975 [Acetobacteraceae bacterium AT-5844]
MSVQSAVSDSNAWGEAAMAKAAALGRRDGLLGRPRDFTLAEVEGALTVVETEQQAPIGRPLLASQSRLLLAAVKQCYVAGYHHGGDVRREQQRRRAATPA